MGVANFEKISNSGVRFATIVDPSVILSKSVSIGEGTIICAGTIATVDISIGKHVIINLDCTLGHDDVIGDFVTICPSVNVSGNVIMNNIYIPHLKWGSRQSRSVT